MSECKKRCNCEQNSFPWRNNQPRDIQMSQPLSSHKTKMAPRQSITFCDPRRTWPASTSFDNTENGLIENVLMLKLHQQGAT